ncbi:MAG TPA: S8 family serine peptidase [Gammaproteobacteria bacterium]|nr:S8 family serine peptidase [Gammaproteobacteria bacterium]
MRFATTILSAVLGIGLALPAIAEIEVQAADSAAIPAADASAKSQVYIIMMRDDPAVAYEGGIAGYKATKPAKGNKIDPNNADVRKYVRYLNSTHEAALRAVGAGDKIYSYSYALNGFAAVLTAAQVEALRTRDDVVQVWQDEIRQPTTDSTPDYLGLTGPGGVWDVQGKGEDIIVGVIDTGIWPEHPSFSDQADFSNATGASGKRNLAYGPPPAGWTGSCQTGENWSKDNCNNKLIGARYYVDGFSAHGHSGLIVSDFLSPRDSDGHGSHTAGTAAGNEGPQNTLNGLPVSGMAPRARIAAYKVCWEPKVGNPGCASSDSAAAIDQAVADGVDVINFSIGGRSTVFASADDIAFLFAADAGVWVATSNGNTGPGAQTIGTPSGVPWITAVGASQDDEVFGLMVTVDTPASIAGDKEALEGASPVSLADTGVIADDVTLTDPPNGCGAALNAPIDGIALSIRGVCSFSEKYNNAAAAGASAIIVYNDGTDPSRFDPIVMSAPGTTIPGVMVGFVDGDAMAGETGVTATLDPDNTVSRDNRIAGFSSRGPNGGAPDVIKPDVAAPGVGIIAAETLQPNANADGGVPYQSISGTSMASPHVAGVFALLKEAHPDWTPAMAKSALMTSARQDLKKTFGEVAADAFDIGAGAIVPAGAFAPGLVYDAGLFDYLAFSCDNNVQLVSDGGCAFLVGLGFPTDGSDLNLPSIGIGEFIGSQTVTRTVTSVSPDGTQFTAAVVPPPGIDVEVNPNSFTLNEGETQTFTVTFTADGAVAGEWAFGSLTWNNDSGQSLARSPIAILPVQISVVEEVDATGTAGSVDIPVAFGYTGDYSAVLSGMAESIGITDSVSTGNLLDAFCGNLPAHTHLRFATFDADTSPAGADLDLRLFYRADGCGGSNPLALIGSSGGVTSEEVIDIVDPPAGGYFFVIDFFSSSTGTIDYTAWVQPVLGDEGNATISAAPASAVAGTSETVTVDYAGLNGDSRYLGVVQHEDGSGEIARTIIDIDTQ